MEELAAKAEEQHLDADVEVPAHKTWRVEDVVGDAADAAPEQMNILLCAEDRCMNSLASSKTEVFEKIEESLRPLCNVKDLNDDDFMSCAYSRMRGMPTRPQQYSIRRSLRHVQRGWDS